MPYMIVTAEGLSVSIAADKLEKKVNKWIEHGWIPHGSVSITFSENTETVAVAQAMVRNTGRNSDQGWYKR